MLWDIKPPGIKPLPLGLILDRIEVAVVVVVVVVTDLLDRLKIREIIILDLPLIPLILPLQLQIPTPILILKDPLIQQIPLQGSLVVELLLDVDLVEEEEAVVDEDEVEVEENMVEEEKVV